jgi:hypothetical protein
MTIQIQIAITAIIFISSFTLQQQTAATCEAITKYENRNQVNYGPLVLSTLSGKVVAEGGKPVKSLGLISNACIGLFSEDEHKFIANTVASEDGSFSIKDVQPGSYRLVVRDPQNVFCVANAPVRLTKPKERAKGKRMVIHLRPAGIDSCSYADYK